MAVLFGGTEPSCLALIPDEDFLSHAPWCYYASYYASFSVDSVPFADYLLTSAGVLRLVVTEWSLHVCGRCKMPADRVSRASKPLQGQLPVPGWVRLPRTPASLTAC